MLFSKCLRAKIYCNVNVHFDPQGCQTLLLKESELFFYLWAPGLSAIWLICISVTIKHVSDHYMCLLPLCMTLTMQNVYHALLTILYVSDHTAYLLPLCISIANLHVPNYYACTSMTIMHACLIILHVSDNSDHFACLWSLCMPLTLV